MRRRTPNPSKPPGCGIRAALRPKEAAELASLAKVFSDPNRVRLLSILAVSSQCPTDLAGMTGIELSVVSHHLRHAAEAGLADWERVRLRHPAREWALNWAGQEAVEVLTRLAK